MIDTRSLKEGSIVTIYLAGDESERIEGTAKCRFANGLFQNIENNRHNGEVYGSSVVSYTVNKCDRCEVKK